MILIAAGQSTLTVGAEIEPSFVCLGPYHLALGMNNRVWYYELGDMSVDFVRDREYLGTVQQIHLNGDYVAVLFDGRVQLHVLEGEGSGGGGGVDGGGDGQGRNSVGGETHMRRSENEFFLILRQPPYLWQQQNIR